MADKQDEASRAGSALAKKRWGKTTEAERAEIAKMLNDYRWADNRKARKRTKARGK